MQKDLEEKSPLFGLSSVFQLPCSSITHSCTKQESELESCDTSRKLHVLGELFCSESFPYNLSKNRFVLKRELNV